MSTSVADHSDRGSEYGSDFTPDEEAILTELLQQLPPPFPSDLAVGIRPDEKIHRATISPRTGSPEPRVKGRGSSSSNSPTVWKIAAKKKTRVSVSLEGDARSVTALEKRTDRVDGENRESPPVPSSNNNDPQEEVPDLRSPLERFRTKPRKPLSVTDLVSPSWCELQYWYSLTKHGRKRRTPAMRQGSAVHKTLEEQVHHTVSVDVQTKEDAWGLRIWNVIQGLWTLRETGMTRELEVWGTVDGLVVNGIIDELSYTCPDRELEEAAGSGAGLDNKHVLPADQSTISSFFPPAFAPKNGPDVLTDPKSLVKSTSRVYLTDVKTRGVNTVPRGAAFRPTLMQLMLYHRLVSDLATNQIDPAVIFDRYSLDPVKTFSDAFIAQFGNLNGAFEAAMSDPESSHEHPLPSPVGPHDAVQLLLDHNSLSRLWARMIQEYRQTMAHGAASIGNVLKVEYRAQRDGSIMGVKTFLYDHKTIQSYLDDEIRWWRGEREVQGVCEEEAYKCGSCEFADECTWRKEKIEAATQRHRARVRSVV